MDSDVDLLIVTSRPPEEFNQQQFSIYTFQKLKDLWTRGNPFAWHLFLESKLIFASDHVDLIKMLGRPNPYKAASLDCESFRSLLTEAANSAMTSPKTAVFDLSVIFLSLRNFATCFTMGMSRTPDFSRKSAANLGVPLSTSSFRILERSRLLCSRGLGVPISSCEVDQVLSELAAIVRWVDNLSKVVNINE